MKTIQIRNVSGEVHRTLKARAAKEGMTLAGYLLRELTYLPRSRTFEEIGERVKQLRLPKVRFVPNERPGSDGPGPHQAASASAKVN